MWYWEYTKKAEDENWKLSRITDDRAAVLNPGKISYKIRHGEHLCVLGTEGRDPEDPDDIRERHEYHTLEDIKREFKCW